MKRAVLVLLGLMGCAAVPTRGGLYDWLTLRLQSCIRTCLSPGQRAVCIDESRRRCSSAGFEATCAEDNSEPDKTGAGFRVDDDVLRRYGL